MMHPYWIVLRDVMGPEWRHGAGITAWSQADTLELRKAAMPTYPVLSIKIISDMQELDQNHVIPNMGNWFVRGVRYRTGMKFQTETMPSLEARETRAQR